MYISFKFADFFPHPQPTLHGICKSEFAVNTMEDIATDVTVTRDLSHCDAFTPKKDFASPLALISGLVRPPGNMDFELQIHRKFIHTWPRVLCIDQNIQYIQSGFT